MFETDSAEFEKKTVNCIKSVPNETGLQVNQYPYIVEEQNVCILIIIICIEIDERHLLAVKWE